MKLLITLLLLTSWPACADQLRIVDGNYLRYEGTDYESAFFPCQSSEVWSIDGGKAFAALVDFYQNTRSGQNGEIRASLELLVLPIDKVQFPNSHFDAVARVAAVISISEAADEIASCR